MALKNKISSFFSTYIHTSIQPLSLRAIPTSRESNLSRLNHTSIPHRGRQPYIHSLLIIFLLSQTFAFAEIRYVSKTGSSTPPYTSWETASDSIQKAINISNFGDTIYVANGVYKEQVVMIPGLSLIGSGMDSCVIDMTDRTTYVNAVVMKDSCLLKGFKIQFCSFCLGGYIRGLGILIDFQDTVKGCTVEYNRIDYAETAMGITGGNIKHNFIYQTRFGIQCFTIDEQREYVAQIDSNYISFWGLSAIYSSKLTIVKATGNLFKPEQINRTSEILNITALSRSYNPELTNNNILKSTNDVVFRRGVVSAYPGTFKNNQFLTKYENLFYTTSNGTYIINNNVVGSENAAFGNPVVKYNNFWKVDTYPDDSTNISVDPMFVNEDSLDFHLQMYSPLIDAGDPDILDKDGSRSDIGLYGGPYGESYKYQDLPPRVPINVTAVLDSEYITISWNKNTESDFRNYNLYRDTVSGFEPSSKNLVLSLEDTSYVHKRPEGIYGLYYKITSMDNQGNESEASSQVSVIFTGVDEYPHMISGYELYQNYPNPFNPSTKIGYRLPEKGYVKIYVYDINGSVVSVLENGEKEAGYYEVEFFARNDLASGIYLYKINITESRRQIPIFMGMKKMILIK